MEIAIKIVLAIIGAILAVMLGCVLAGVIVYFLWNWVAVDAFNAPVLTFWQAIGLSILCGLLFKSSSSSK